MVAVNNRSIALGVELDAAAGLGQTARQDLPSDRPWANHRSAQTRLIYPEIAALRWQGGEVATPQFPKLPLPRDRQLGR